MVEQAQKANYRKTLNLPRTSFAMKANLVQNEPASQKRWDAASLYAQIRAARQGAAPFFFHDGPPYANGPIHLGHLLNKVLKDFVVRSRTMMGFDVPYVPGWDCHGLPIEHKVIQDLGDKARSLDPMTIRRKCRSSAEKFVKLQNAQMQRLLTLADYDHPYLTMSPQYESAVLEVFADLVAAGVIYRGLKPVHWSIENRTALAEAELEYYDRDDESIFVRFDLAGASGDGALMIWTTTPWTLPANLAVAVHPDYTYGEYDVGGQRVLVAVELAARVLETSAPPRRTLTGAQMVGMQYRHPFADRVGRVVAADYVTLDDGTGLVHTAPGHGVDDYLTGVREGLEIYCPVEGDGRFDDSVADWLRGRSVWEANPLIVEHLRRSGHLFRCESLTHSYPHDWRGKTPVVFRATEQWFVSVDKPVHGGATLRQRALDAAEAVAFFPTWGRNRLRGMLESRPDWCLSRQRAWGLPIPAFYAPPGADGPPLLSAASVRAVAQVLRERGSDVWFQAAPDQLLVHYDPAQDPDAPDWARSAADRAAWGKSTDIFDVWFESGSSWHAVMRQRFGAAALPTDLYLEGSDQHRGWFQLSLLPALGATGNAPFRAVLTHGFMVDKDGRKMSKSLGNTLEVEDLLKQYGADVCRWWVSSLNADNDIKVDAAFFKVAGEQYRKVRNTIRFLLSNLGDFDPARDAHTFTAADAASVDAWVAGELRDLVQAVRAAYERYDHRLAHEALFGFCNETLSAVYLVAVKDRLYCDRADSPRRRRTQTVLYQAADVLVRLLAPLLPHTADEAWAALTGAEGSVHLERLPEVESAAVAVDAHWATVMTLRDDFLRQIESFRQSHDVDNPLDLGLTVTAADPACAALSAMEAVDLADLCGVSQFHVRSAPAGQTEAVQVAVMDLSDEPRCERSWKRDGTVRQRRDGGWLSDRDADVLGV